MPFISEEMRYNLSYFCSKSPKTAICYEEGRLFLFIAFFLTASHLSSNVVPFHSYVERKNSILSQSPHGNGFKSTQPSIYRKSHQRNIFMAQISYGNVYLTSTSSKLSTYSRTTNHKISTDKYERIIKKKVVGSTINTSLTPSTYSTTFINISSETHKTFTESFKGNVTKPTSFPPEQDCPLECKCEAGNDERCRVTSPECGKPLNSIGYCTYFCSKEGYCGFGDSYQTDGSTDCFACNTGLDCDKDYIVSSRSITGYDACRVKPHSMPWIVRLALKDNPRSIQTQFCGGTLISQKLVLTAEHCVQNKKWKTLVAVVGEHDITKEDDGEQIFDIQDHIRHPNMGFECMVRRGRRWTVGKARYRSNKKFLNSYVGQSLNNEDCAKRVWTEKPKARGAMRRNNDGGCYAVWRTILNRRIDTFQTCYLKGITSYGFDMGILVLNGRVIMSEKIRHAKLPEENENCNRIGKRLIAGGWGYGIPTPGGFQTYPNKWSRYPWAVQQQCLNLENCDMRTNEDREAILCVGDNEKIYNSACRADSGGPLTYSKGNETVLFGVLHGQGKGRGEHYCKTLNKFGRVSEPKTLQWIKKQVNKYK